MQSASLGGNLTGRGHDGKGAHLLGVRGLVLQEFTLQLMDLNLSIGVEHAAREGERESGTHHD